MMASNSLAHLPAFDTGGDSYEDAEWIDDLVTSYAFYGEVPAMTPCDPSGAKYYVFEGRSGEEFRFEVGVPVHSALAKPCILLLGPGLPNPDEIAQNIIDSSNLTIPEGYGAMGWAFVIRPDADYYIETQFEPFTQTVFAYAYQKDILLPSDGTYYIVFTSIVNS
ncbi:MAG: hypothetical protein IH630_04545, partial [Thermoplasmata archaeon]|nr:hypothetical protein [Thermoplasmata archaeon]